MTKEEIINMVNQFECGMFANRDTMQESRDYAEMLLKSSSLSERSFASMTALTVHQNTMVKVLLQMIEDSFNDESNTTKV